MLGVGAAAGAAYAWFEAGWIRRETVDVPLPRLPPELDGLRIAHLSDFHLGVPSRGERAVERAVEWAARSGADLVCISGDLLTHPRGEERLRRLLERLPGAYAVLGNHDFGVARDPLARARPSTDLSPAILLADDASMAELRGRRVQVVGVDPATYRLGASRPAERADAGAGLRILLCHFPDVVRTLPAGVFDLVLAGHYHGGQICVPSPWGKVRLKDLRGTYWEGAYEARGATLHVSRGLGTSFVPFRLLARPEATLLTLRRGRS